MIFRLTNKICVFILIGICCALLSCSDDFLNVAPEDRVSKENFFKDKSDLQSAVDGIYAAERDLYAAGELGLYNVEETRSDNTNQKDGRQSEHRAVDNFTAFGGNTSYTQYWGFAYNVINLANTVVDRASDVEMDETERKKLIGEARFIRANTYFKLVKDFGEVPLRLKETVSLSGDNSKAKSPLDSIYMAITDDLSFAAENLPSEYSGEGLGRATSNAAYGMLGKVQLQKGDKEAAIEALNNIDASQYELLSNYDDLWVPGNKNTKESLYEIQFHPSKTGSPFWNFFAPNSLGIPGGDNMAVAPNTPTKDLLEAYEAGDKRKDASIDYTPDGKPYIIKFKDPEVSVGNDANVNFPVLRYAEVLLLLAEAKGENSESYNLINQVRNRAGLSNIGQSSPGSFLDKIMHERRVELAFEAHRWHDILRMEKTKAIDAMNKHLKNEYPNDNYAIDEHDLLNPIPTTEIQNNDKMEQNPGY